MSEPAAVEPPLPAAPDESEIDAPTRPLAGTTHRLATALATGLAIYALYWAVGIIQPQVYRSTFLLVVLVLTFLWYPAPAFARRASAGRRQTARGRVTALDWALVGLSTAALVWPLVDFEAFVYRAATPTAVDLALGVATIVLVLEATRRTVGAVLPVTAVLFLAYAFYGPLLDWIGLSVIAHRGYDISRIVGTLYMTLEGIFGVPLDVASTYIILFTIYGAILRHSGAGQFFLDWATAALGRSGGSSGPGRAVTLAGFLLGAVSGSGVATTVTMGTVAWPMLRRAGYGAETAGAVLSAAGIGAILSPPTMGAAAFLIAELLHVPYLHVLAMAVVPTALYYLSVTLMIEADARSLHPSTPARGDLSKAEGQARSADVETPSLAQLTLRYGYHFSSLFVIVGLLVSGMTAFRAVVWATLVAVGLSFLRTETALGPRRLLAALETGGRGVLAVAATTAAAGIIVGIVTLTGLGLKMSGLIVSLAGGQLLLTLVYAAIGVWLLGLAVPVTASYIIAAVMIAPALTLVGVPEVAAHMFVFYYAVLSEVSPPTALSPFAAAAITGGNPFRTMMLTWRYTLPAFLVPFAFTLDPAGLALLLQAPWPDVVRATATAALGVTALAFGVAGRWRRPAGAIERGLALTGGLLLFYATALTDLTGAMLVSAAAGLHLLRARPA